jgi:hypothetical protein
VTGFNSSSSSDPVDEGNLQLDSELLSEDLNLKEEQDYNHFA